MKIACLSFTEKGKEIGDRLKNLNKDDGKYLLTHYANGEVEDKIKGIMNYVWNEYDGLVFISSTGIAVRMITPYIKDKIKDPAVVVIDDCGRFSISLLSGHLGGANELSEWLGEKINAIPVITTASDNRKIEAVDLFAKRNKYYLEDMESIKKITAMMVNGKNIGFYSEDNKIINYPNLTVLEDLDYINPKINGIIIVSSQDINLQNINIPIAYLRPRNINIGVGCRKDIEAMRIIEAIEEVFYKAKLSVNSIKAIGTVEVKKNEKGIIDASKHFNCPMKIFTIDEIKEVQDKFDKSQFVKDNIGVYSVSEPSAYLLGGELIVNKSKHNGITISISKEIRNG
ncbi:cobalt-precorrin 5A hydrolase [Tissierella praeacuta]|uniref:cobalt-precorrin 5A hydrolase n=1 Tax=Tissierella praeacuta TaxID=43131 RepID=UPI000EC949A2|nr:cobalt-precorrin 5A hydrolase [Tissierella praeacuta]MBU5256615.1 cobalt-precorrin 5A hydrolase [Tissierella praeacuta]HAE92568.1 cobalt-precorrin 5A hydrolase [Tissierella sp.]